MSASQVALVRVVDPNGWAYLDSYAPVHGLKWSWNYSGGPTACSFSLGADARASIPHLTQGASAEVLRGASTVWAGRVASVDRSGWAVQCDGLGGLVVQETVKSVGTLDAIVDAAIADGLPLSRPASLSTTPWGKAGTLPTDGTTLDQVLSQVLGSAGKAWQVGIDGKITAAALPTTPTLIVEADTAPPLTLNAYATRVTVIYDAVGNLTPNAQVTVVNAAAEAKFGRVSRTVNLVYVNPGWTSSQATGAANALLNRLSPRMTLSGDYTVTDGQVLTASGGPVDLPSLRPGQVARMQLVSFARDTLAGQQSSVDMLIGATEYDADAGTLTLSPMQSTPDPLAVMFGGRAFDVSPSTA